MNPTVRKILIISAKNAVNALLTNISASEIWPQLFNIHTRAGWFAILKLIGTVVASREIMVWGPKILKWSQSIEENGVNQ